MSALSEAQIKAAVLRVLNGIAPEIELDAIDPSRDLRDQVDIDSVDFLNFVIGLHNDFQIEIPDADMPKLATLNSCVEYLGSRVKQPLASGRA
jgi:acyl carrier protein